MAEVKPVFSAKRVVTTSFVVDLLDFLINLAVAILTGSVVIYAEALQGATNVISSLFLIFGVSLSKKSKDKAHQFGHGRELYFWTLLAALAILLASGIPSVLIGVNRIMRPHMIENIAAAYTVLIIAVFTNFYALSVSTRRLIDGKGLGRIWGEIMKNPRVETKAAFVLDLMGFSAAISGIVSLAIYSITGDLRFDGVGAAVIGVFMILFSLLLVAGIKDLIIGKRIPEGMERKIKKIIGEFDEVREILNFKSMYMGPDSIMISTVIYVKHDLDVKKIEKLIDALQDSIQEKVPEARFIDIEVETPRVEKKQKEREKTPEDY